MTIAMRHVGALPISARAAPHQVAPTQVFDTLAAAEPHWRVLEDAGALMTPYQRFDFLSLWQRHIGS
ncbi:MAG: GNAT family N-acetyltransferase, partial [Pseudolabrys sp.]|nr:GNAT family N-acetyltransferase [Pseudolabrys sp.]